MGEGGKEVWYSQANPHTQSPPTCQHYYLTVPQFMVIVASVPDKHMLALTFLGVPVPPDFRVVFCSATSVF